MTLEERVQALLQEGRTREAATVLIQTLGPQVLAYLTALLGDESAAREVFSRFAEDLWKGLTEWRGDVPLRAWAYRIAWRASVRWRGGDLFRSPQRSRTTGAALARQLRELSAERAWRKERMARRRELDPEERTLLILRVDRGLSWREVAYVLAEGPRS